MSQKSSVLQPAKSVSQALTPDTLYKKRAADLRNHLHNPTSASKKHGSHCGPSAPGSRLDADYPENGVLIPCRFTFSQTDFTDDLKKITVPVLVMHGDDDQIVPYADAGPLSAKLLKNGTLKTYKGFPHGMPTTQADTIKPTC